MFSSKGWGAKKALEFLGLTFLSLLFVISFQSKALINIFFLLSFVTSIIYIAFFNKAFFREKKYVWLFIGPYISGFILGFFSENGVIGSIEFLQQFRFMIIILPLACFVKSKKEMIFLLIMVYASAFIAIFYGIYKNQPYGGFHGFHSIGRTADMLVVLLLASLAYIIQSRFTFNLRSNIGKLILLGTALTLAWAVLMTEMRGAWLGVFIGVCFIIIGLFFLKQRWLAFSLLLLIMLSSVTFLKTYDNIDTIKNQIASIADTQNDISNKTRLNLWKTGWDFSKEQFIFGTGAKQASALYKNFYDKQDDSYKAKYHYVIHHMGDYHNSYLQIHVETGIIFFIIYITSMAVCLLYFIKRIQKIPFEDRKYPLAALVSSLAFLSIQFFHSELYSYGSTTFYLILFAALYILNENDKVPSLQKGLKDEK
ncbi:O-antigen ligase family protein [Marinomonas hwangdonensis]|uniref:O-antigen ligase family protein n=1 Tax=Marinomonas hwangdonensis TaxID=1053647 RepID=A0A3M8PY99_9GAMM|nr:O-antigen ligase family protein [Marinomonas hwangdonensis]RNF48815.1 O-antigen ligase family protein [Marinomonas hwangdonensis]